MPDERFRLTHLSAEGFRGINEKLDLAVDGQSTILSGPNGSGKTTILQAIEWGLYGWIPHMRGAEFDLEDAIVNQFNPQDTARVELTLRSPSSTVKVTRTRKRRSSSRRGSILTVEVDGETLKGEEAQARLVQLLGLSEDEFYAGAYLHQEALNEFVVGDPTLRSETLDRLLGTYSLRDLIDSLPVTTVTRRRNEVEAQIRSLQSEELTKLPAAREKLHDMRETLLVSGLRDEDLDIHPLAKSTADVARRIQQAADELQVFVPYVEPPAEDIAILQKAISQLRSNLDTLAKAKFQTYRGLTDRRASLTSLREQLRILEGRVKKLSGVDPRSLEGRIRSLNVQIAENDSKRCEVRKLRDDLQTASVELRGLSDQVAGLQKETERLVAEHGSLEAIAERRASIEKESQALKGAIEGLEAYGHIQVQALEYLREHRPELCPVCKASIDPLKTAARLEAEIAENDVGARVLDLRQSLRKLQEEDALLANTARELQGLEQRTVQALEALKNFRSRVAERHRLPEATVESVQERLERIESDLASLDAAADQLTREETQLEAQVTELKDAQSAIENLAQRIRAETGISAEIVDLDAALTRALDETEQRIKAFESMTSELEALNGEMGKLEGALAYLIQEREVLRLEQEAPELEAELRELEDKRRKLAELEEGLADIRDAALAEQRSIVTEILGQVSGEVSKYYSRLMGHPYYADLALSLDTTGTKNLYRIRARGPEHETHVQTRFSNAQLNATAIAVFTAMARRLPHNLNLMVLDDPTQSFDDAHKEALASMMAEQTKETQLILATQDAAFEEQLTKVTHPRKLLRKKITKWTTRGPAMHTDDACRSLTSDPVRPR
ncbi:MAG: AAA family ATPase [Candidatus Bathyarchaeia archaeon]